MNRRIFLTLTLLLAAGTLGRAQAPADEAALLRRAEKLHDRIISIDTHTDTALDLLKADADLSRVQADFAKLREGRVDCCFYPIFVDQGPLDDAAREKAYVWTLEKMKAIRA